MRYALTPNLALSLALSASQLALWLSLAVASPEAEAVAILAPSQLALSWGALASPPALSHLKLWRLALRERSRREGHLAGESYRRLKRRERSREARIGGGETLPEGGGRGGRDRPLCPLPSPVGCGNRAPLLALREIASRWVCPSVYLRRAPKTPL